MLVPMIIPIVYALRHKRDSIREISLIAFTMILIVIGYWPLTLGFNVPSNIITKFFLFVVLPLVVLYFPWKIRQKQNTDFPFYEFGITDQGIEKSLKLGFLFIPLMLLVTFLAKYLAGGIAGTPDFPLGVISFVESFSEEFFFRGILFLFLLPRTNLQVAYTTSLLSFVLMHPQHFTDPFILSTITQGIVTLEICRRSKNLVGSWVLHGTNRFFSIVLLPLMM